MSQRKGWGIKWSPAIKHIDGLACPHCGRMSRMIDGQDYETIVGLDPQGPQGSLGTLVFVLECPNCCEHYWLHTTYIAVELAAKKCPEWPKNELSPLDSTS